MPSEDSYSDASKFIISRPPSVRQWKMKALTYPHFLRKAYMRRGDGAVADGRFDAPMFVISNCIDGITIASVINAECKSSTDSENSNLTLVFLNSNFCDVRFVSVMDF